MKVLAITGYKAHELQVFKNNDPAVHYIKKAIQKRLESLLEEHAELEWIVISGQQGVELWAAEVVFEMQVEYSHLKLAVLTPYLNQQENGKIEIKSIMRQFCHKLIMWIPFQKNPMNRPFS